MRRVRLRWIAALAAAALAACSAANRQNVASGAAPSAAEAARFVTQASFGPDDGSISSVRTQGYAGWIDQQILTPAQGSYLADIDARLVELRATNPSATLAPTNFYEIFWRRAATDPDQLRQRVAFALSEIFVISLTDANIDVRGAASYYDVLRANSFGNFRTLLEQVSLHPMMGVYLTWLGNQKEDPATGRNPDENYAREVMQLMSIGLVQLNPDGTPRRDQLGRTTPTYDAADIAGLAKVLTGYSYYSPTPTNNTFAGRNLPADARVRFMIPYASFHSTSAKSFLDVTIPASGVSDPAGDLRIALDTLANHPNVGPFISRQLIQRLVTSNPSPSYVRQVAAVFDNNGAGVRGDLGAVVKAILTNAEARGAVTAASPNFGKVREPIVRMTNWMRAFNATSQTGDWTVPVTSGNTSLGQSPLTSPSVFNFYRPGYSPPNTRTGTAGLVAPEFQIVDEVSVAGYLNTIQTTIDLGIGSTVNGTRDVRSTYAAEIAIAGDPAALVERMNLLLLQGQMSSALRTRITDAVAAIPANANNAMLNRAKLAAYMSMASSEYMVQR